MRDANYGVLLSLGPPDRLHTLSLPPAVRRRWPEKIECSKSSTESEVRNLTASMLRPIAVVRQYQDVLLYPDSSRLKEQYAGYARSFVPQAREAWKGLLEVTYLPKKCVELGLVLVRTECFRRTVYLGDYISRSSYGLELSLSHYAISS